MYNACTWNFTNLWITNLCISFTCSKTFHHVFFRSETAKYIDSLKCISLLDAIINCVLLLSRISLFLLVLSVSLVFQFLLTSLRLVCKVLRYVWYIVRATLCLISDSQTNSSFETILFNDSVEIINYSLNCKG